MLFKVPALESWSDNVSVIVSAAMVVMLLILSNSTWSRYIGTIRAGGGEFIDPVSAYISDNSKPEDLVLTWYPEMGVNFMAGRTSPVKYLYYPLFLDGSLTKEIEDRYFDDLTKSRLNSFSTAPAPWTPSLHWMRLPAKHSMPLPA